MILQSTFSNAAVIQAIFSIIGALVVVILFFLRTLHVDLKRTIGQGYKNEHKLEQLDIKKSSDIDLLRRDLVSGFEKTDYKIDHLNNNIKVYNEHLVPIIERLEKKLDKK
jgi:hypothetical protein